MPKIDEYETHGGTYECPSDDTVVFVPDINATYDPDLYVPETTYTLEIL